MSASPESELDLDLHFLPAWAQESPDVNRYAKYEGGGEQRGPARGDRSDRRGPRPTRGERSPGREQAGGGKTRPFGPRGDQPRGDDRQAPRFGKFGRDERREPALSLPQINVTFIPEEKGVESLARQIKLTGRAYPLFEIAHLILKKPDRYQLQFSVIKNATGQAVQPLWVCNLDETVWLSEPDAIDHVLRRHFDTFYQTERTPTEPPKGTYTFVAQCGLSDTILGPPNYHDYQTKLRKLHAERFARMPFEVYKSRVKIVRDEAIVKRWLEDQSFKTEYNCLNVPEAKKLISREEVERHFREIHLPNIIKSVESFLITKPAARQFLPPLLEALSRQGWEDQRRFPLRMATTLSQQFASHGLQFFKVNKTVTHVAVARPHYLDMNATPVSEGVKRIVDFICATPRCTRRKLLDALVPAPIPVPAAGDAVGEGSAQADPGSPTPEMRAVIGDLHWLIHQGHVIEFANGVIEMARQPAPRPPKPTPMIPQPPKTTSPEATQTVADKPDEAGATVPAEVASGGTAENLAAINKEPVALPLAESGSEPAPPVLEPGPEPIQQNAP
jgi:hypothetical protein